jgi:flavin reductase (DIM6/NTAB) family NADH-FMN oxidoreductase RutF
VAEAPVHLECRLERIVEIEDVPVGLVLGRVLLYHVREDLLEDGVIRPEGLRAVGRLGGSRYCRTADLYSIERPKV